MNEHPLVLVVDDDPDILDAICDILEGEGYRVARARHGLEALDRVAEEEPSIILLDLMMPVMDGLAFAQALRQRRNGAARIPIVVISADGNPQKAASVGAQGYLAKPFDIDALLAQVTDMAGQAMPG
ncbi:response regulator receiver protein [Anaeromyxobacter sp. K]|uniref:Response regulator receiver protein n=1 Tax=Anaeromyxobacter dehalogenans (strain ATCC BAA-258 / DSM 21875 / 2CP-1) TaxID=455488 RepID=B8J816_ANAD2|nr:MULTISPECIES: response regulator [Anaeromyxobacter]ACG73117.1 response regulator receiver protein [Anaeromyxobacter sp. K]ACL65315.1 response regulator receiver protein [Anaeromyxobacter dehalogenans 2CP-1]